MKIIYEKEELLSLIKTVLAYNGLKISGTLVFKAQTKRGSAPIEQYELEVACEAAPLPPKCPLCGHTTTPCVTSSGVPEKASETLATVHKPMVLDTELGETLEPPYGAVEPSDNASRDGASIKSLVAQGRRIEREKNRTRPSSPRLMSGESTKPPTY